MIAKTTAIMTVINRKFAARTIIHQTIAAIKKMIVLVVRNVLRGHLDIDAHEVLPVKPVLLVRKVNQAAY